MPFGQFDLMASPEPCPSPAPVNVPMFKDPLDTVNNHVFFYKTVDVDSVLLLQRTLLTTKISVTKQAADYGQEVPPIHLHIYSPGGKLLAGFQGADFVERQGIYTHIEGGAASAATLISVCGKHRTITKHSFILIHQLSSGFWGKYEEFKDQQNNLDQFMKNLEDIYLAHTKIKKEDLKEMLKHDLWFTAKEALRYGLVDEII